MVNYLIHLNFLLNAIIIERYIYSGRDKNMCNV